MKISPTYKTQMVEVPMMNEKKIHAREARKRDYFYR
jgi:hypothetical protein